ncbi:KTSC domain-containing protein [Edaphovirga cremea]|uniref:KTSC domain-containing protein n=1 Tax=Edaphovirga cremea TaxID=2267246 RepID=UPI000DEEC674|nr:KTSC domain-containing protein [Edaphovirga cremea]
MRRETVPSARIQSIGYDHEQNTLEIEFKDNSVYQYINVPERIYKDFISPKITSKGRFFDGVIQGKFLCRKIQ